MKTLKLFTTLLFIILVYVCTAQQANLGFVSVQARVLEQLKGNIKSVPNTSLKMIGIGDYSTNEEGRFAFQIPMDELSQFDNEMVIKIVLPDYEIIKPFEGKVQLDTSKSEVFLDILVMGRDIEEEYKKKLTELGNKLRTTQKKNSISLKKMSAMNDSLLQALEKDAKQQVALEQSIEELEAKVAKESDEKSKYASELRDAIDQMQSLNNALAKKENELYVALEEKYLRQQKYQKSISGDLNEYLIQVKDVQDLLQNLDNYFKPGKYPNYTSTYNSTLKAYNQIFQEINEKHSDYIEGVNRYWEDELLVEQVEETFDMVFDQVHHPLLKPAINEVNILIRKNRSGKASKVAHEAFHNLNPYIINLEKAVNRLIPKL
jgi:hypothetical protein